MALTEKYARLNNFTLRDSAVVRSSKTASRKLTKRVTYAVAQA